MPSKALRLHDRGLVELGQRADLVLVQGNPMKDIEAIKHIKKLWV